MKDARGFGHCLATYDWGRRPLGFQSFSRSSSVTKSTRGAPLAGWVGVVVGEVAICAAGSLLYTGLDSACGVRGAFAMDAWAQAGGFMQRQSGGLQDSVRMCCSGESSSREKSRGEARERMDARVARGARVLRAVKVVVGETEWPRERRVNARCSASEDRLYERWLSERGGGGLFCSSASLKSR